MDTRNALDQSRLACTIVSNNRCDLTAPCPKGDIRESMHCAARGAAGDLGHIPYSGEGGPVCRCGNNGCVEAYAGGWALIRDLRALGHDVQSSSDVVRLIRAGQPDAVRLARQAGRVVGQAISDAVSFFNPSLVVIGGQLAHADEPLLAGIREVVYRRSLPLATRDLQITTSKLDERAGVTGLALMLGDHIFAPDAIDRALGADNVNSHPESAMLVTLHDQATGERHFGHRGSPGS